VASSREEFREKAPRSSSLRVFLDLESSLQSHIESEYSSVVVCSDWSPDGEQLAVVRFEGCETYIEFPLGKILYRTVSS
jgi:hypothetical protein